MRQLVLLLAFGLAACNQGQGPEGGAANQGPAPAPAQAARLVPKAGAPSLGAHGQPLAAGSQPIAGSQPVAAGSLPAGHPPVGDLPAGHPPVGDAPAGQPPVGDLPAGHPPVAPGGAGSQPVAPVGAGGSVGGTLKLAPELAGQVRPGTMLFLIVRQDLGEGQRGTLLAAKKVPVSGPEMFPYAYEVSSADVMMQGTALTGKVRIEARVDGDGDALSKLPGDLVGGPVATEVGQTGVDFTLSTAL